MFEYRNQCLQAFYHSGSFDLTASALSSYNVVLGWNLKISYCRWRVPKNKRVSCKLKTNLLHNHFHSSVSSLVRLLQIIVLLNRIQHAQKLWVLSIHKNHHFLPFMCFHNPSLLSLWQQKGPRQREGGRSLEVRREEKEKTEKNKSTLITGEWRLYGNGRITHFLSLVFKSQRPFLHVRQVLIVSWWDVLIIKMTWPQSGADFVSFTVLLDYFSSVWISTSQFANSLLVAAAIWYYVTTSGNSGRVYMKTWLGPFIDIRSEVCPDQRGCHSDITFQRFYKSNKNKKKSRKATWWIEN